MAVASLICVWLLAWAGYTLARNSKMTAEKLRAYCQSIDLNKLSGAERTKAIQKLVDKLNALSPEERRRMREGKFVGRWFDEMTEEEKGAFIEATMPTGFKQMIAAFEQLPEEKRRGTIDDAMKRLREAREKMAAGKPNEISGGNTNAPPLSKELEVKMRTIGLKTFYSQSSAQTKAELAPVLEELQNAMHSAGTWIERRRR